MGLIVDAYERKANSAPTVGYGKGKRAFFRFFLKYISLLFFVFSKGKYVADIHLASFLVFSFGFSAFFFPLSSSHAISHFQTDFPPPPPSSDHQPLLSPLRQRQEMVFPISTHAHLFLHERKNQTFPLGEFDATILRIFMHLPDLKNMEYVKRKCSLFLFTPCMEKGKGKEEVG